MRNIPLPKPLFDTLENVQDEIVPFIISYIQTLNISEGQKEYELARQFLLSYAGSQDTFNAYRREVERLLQWSWLILKKPIKELTRNDIRDYIHFVNNPPPQWITTKNIPRFIEKNGERIFNPAWKPFVAKISKAKHWEGETPDKENYQLKNRSIAALFAVLSTFFTYLQQDEYVSVNPVTLVRQKSQFIQREQTRRVTRKLSQLQWQMVITTAEEMANQHSKYERILFTMSAFYLLGLRISELAETPGRIPKMGDFAPDKHGLWWFTTVGKGNKIRDVAVPDAMLDILKRYRLSLGLSALPSREEPTPLLNKERGRGGLGTRQVRNLVQRCFNKAIYKLEQNGKQDEAQDLATATVHWLRHTAISADVQERPREHIRDDVGHENAATMDKYIDTDRQARHASAKHKRLNPETEKTC
jgi:site-specific recombinase XerD